MRREIRRLANTTEMTLHEISEVVGVRNIGRVSEVLNGKC
jgi:predicted XRE-type DNA-binding protein